MIRKWYKNDIYIFCKDLLVFAATHDVIMLTHDGYYRQVDGLAMGSPPTPQLANGWMSKFDAEIKGDSYALLKIYGWCTSWYQEPSNWQQIDLNQPSSSFAKVHCRTWNRFFNSIFRHENSQKKRKAYIRMVHQAYRHRIDHEFSRARPDEIQEIGCLRVGSSNSSLVQHVEAISW